MFRHISEYTVMWTSVWEHPTNVVPFSNAKHYQSFLTSPVQYTDVTLIVPSSVRPVPFCTLAVQEQQ